MSDLNLLPSVAKFQAAKMKVRRQTKKANIMIASGWLISVVLVMGGWYFFSKRLEGQEKMYQKSVNELTSMSNEMASTQQLKFKSKLVGQILTKRFEYYEALGKVKDLFSSEIEVSKTDIKDSSTIALEASSSKMDGINEVEKKMTEAKTGQLTGVAEIKLNNLSYELDGGWKFNLEVGIR